MRLEQRIAGKADQKKVRMSQADPPTNPAVACYAAAMAQTSDDQRLEKIVLYGGAAGIGWLCSGLSGCVIALGLLWFLRELMASSPRLRAVVGSAIGLLIVSVFLLWMAGIGMSLFQGSRHSGGLEQEYRHE